MIYAALAAIPWLLLAGFMALRLREPRELPPIEAAPSSPGPSAALTPLVSIIVPARNEARNIRACLESLTSVRGVGYEILVVDDRSIDQTAAIARSVAAGRASSLRVIDGRELPEGWFGKPWACHQGAGAARGSILLFTDADTTHGPDLLLRSLAAMEEDRAHALSLVGRQRMETFAERLVQPQMFLLLALRFRRLDRVMDARRWRDAIANGQFVLVRRGAYEAAGGHEGVRGEVVEDLRLAQELTRGGHRLTVRRAADAFSTRMYTSLGEIVEGWTKNLAIGARQAAGWWAPVAVPGILAFLAFAWLLPVAALAAAAIALALDRPEVARPLAVWAGPTSTVTLALWAGVYRRLGVSARHAALYPAGTLVVVFIVLRSWARGTRRIEWKGRRYGHAGSGPAG